jgi:signal peptidase II
VVFERSGGVQDQVGDPSPDSGTERRPGSVRRIVIAGSVAVVVVVVDQVTKSWAVRRLSHGEIHVVWKLDLELTYNSGASFGVARGWAPIIAAIAVTAVVVLLAVVRRVRSDALAVALGLVIGGALGNLTDRVVRGHHGAVVDFIALHFWPTFNVADSCIVIGAIVAALLISHRDNRGADGASGAVPAAPPDAPGSRGDGPGVGPPGWAAGP